MIELARRLSILKEAAIMAIRDFPPAEQMVSPVQVWTHLSSDLQVHVVRLLAQLAAHLVLTEGERTPLGRKESSDVLSSLAQQDPA